MIPSEHEDGLASSRQFCGRLRDLALTVKSARAHGDATVRWDLPLEVAGDLLAYAAFARGYVDGALAKRRAGVPMS